MSDEFDYSGQFRVRLPKELHAALADRAQQEHVSLNTLIVALLAGAVSWQTERQTKT